MEPSPHEADGAPVPEPVVPFRIISLIPDDGKEPSSTLTDREASAAWSAASIPWHPALLALADDLPRLENLAFPSDPQPGDLFVVPQGKMFQLSEETRQRAEALGVPIVETGADRFETIRKILARSPDPSRSIDPADPVARDFLALGSAHWWLRDLTNAMGHVDTLSRSSLLKEAVNGAKAWASGDPSGATNRLRASFELITEARERFYPLDGYVLDLCLLDPASPADSLASVLEPHTPFTLIAPARAIEAFAEAEPALAEKLREAITEGWADVVGGPFSEADEPFLPWSTISWQFRKGAEIYRRHLDDRNVETLARRKFEIYPQLPQIARRFGLRFAIYGCLDAGRFPVPTDAKRMWASPDGTTLESLTRTPISADRAVEGARLAWKVGRSMREDSSTTIPLAHWPSPVAGWYEDFRRTSAYSPIFARWITVNDFFHRSDRPFEEVKPTLDELAPAYLVQAAGRRDPSPISSRAAHLRGRARLDALIAIHALESCLSVDERQPIDPAIEDAFETGRPDALGMIDEKLDPSSRSLAGTIVEKGSKGRAGFLILNPLGVTRRATVLLPDAAADLRPEGPLRAAQFTEDGVWAVVDLPPFGYSWVPRDSNADRQSASQNVLSIRDKTLTNEAMTLSIDPATGGLRGVQAFGEDTARLGQQLCIVGLVGPDGKPASSKMKGLTFSADYGGPALVQATSTGTLHDPKDDRILAVFRQRFRIWTGRPTLEIDIEFTEIDPEWLASVAGADPWSNYLAIRWAWPDSQSTLRRTALLAPTSTDAERLETPDAVDITSRQRRTTLLFGGLAHHKRHGQRMLDTILVAGSETARTFQVGVALDLEHPFAAVLDFTAPALVVPLVDTLPSGPTGWLLQVDHKSVVIARLEFTDKSGEGNGVGLVADLIETAGKAARCRLRAYRDPLRARQLDGHGEHVLDLVIEGDAALVDLTPHEICRVELTLGQPAEPGDDPVID
jgi:alpha-mannosidase